MFLSSARVSDFLLAQSSLISTPTPAGRSSFISASTVCGVGSKMSISRLCVRISNCSRDFLSTCGERRTVHRSSSSAAESVPPAARPVRLRRVDDLGRRLVEDPVVVRLESDSDSVVCHLTLVSLSSHPSVPCCAPVRSTPHFFLESECGGGQAGAFQVSVLVLSSF